MADNSRPDDYNEETQYDTFEEASQEEQPKQSKYEDYVKKESEPEAEQEEEDDIPEKYQGKEVKDIVAMHQNAEKLLGKQSQEVGELRKVVDDFIRSQTVQQQQPEAQDDLDELDFFENPKAAVSRMLENHPSVKQSQNMAIELKKQETVAKLKSQHPEYTTILADGKFIEWIGKSKVRTSLLQRADQDYDYDSADELFSLWKERQNIVSDMKRTNSTARKQSVRSASTGSAKGSGERATKKVYRRADIVELMQKDPERYAALAPEIRQAYADGRVR
jgi:hypothetical protein